MGFFKAPNSFTTQDMVEIHCHGGAYSTNRILEAAVSAGCRLAEPGEFSCRAVLGGRLDISQAEAICQLIESKTGNESKAALDRLKNRNGGEIGSLVEYLIDLAAQIEVQIDFPDDSQDEKVDFGAMLKPPIDRLRTWLLRYQQNRIYFEGAVVVICGPPNVGKSSLFNRLVGMERNIVSPEPAPPGISLKLKSSSAASAAN